MLSTWLWWTVLCAVQRKGVLGLDADAKTWIEETYRRSEYCRQYSQGRGSKYDHARPVEDVVLPGHQHVEPVRVGFVTSNPKLTPQAGDIFSCANLGKALQSLHGWNVTALVKGNSWYDARDVDLLVVALDRYDLRRVTTNNQDMLVVAWVRNWFRRWWKRPWHNMYHIYMASSASGADWLHRKLRTQVKVLRLAADHETFYPRSATPDLTADFTFVGSNWGGKRELFYLDVAAINGSCAFYGRMLDQIPNLHACEKGVMEYSDTAKLYSSSKIVVDDTNHATGPWGSLNGRVYEGIAAGSLVVTNNVKGGQDALDGNVPSWTTASELRILLQSLLQDEKERTGLAHQLRLKVLERHTYTHRAMEFVCNLGEYLQSSLQEE